MIYPGSCFQVSEIRSYRKRNEIALVVIHIHNKQEQEEYVCSVRSFKTTGYWYLEAQPTKETFDVLLRLLTFNNHKFEGYVEQSWMPIYIILQHYFLKMKVYHVCLPPIKLAVALLQAQRLCKSEPFYQDYIRNFYANKLKELDDGIYALTFSHTGEFVYV